MLILIIDVFTYLKIIKHLFTHLKIFFFEYVTFIIFQNIYQNRNFVKLRLQYINKHFQDFLWLKHKIPQNLNKFINIILKTY